MIVWYSPILHYLGFYAFLSPFFLQGRNPLCAPCYVYFFFMQYFPWILVKKKKKFMWGSVCWLVLTMDILYLVFVFLFPCVQCLMIGWFLISKFWFPCILVIHYYAHNLNFYSCDMGFKWGLGLIIFFLCPYQTCLLEWIRKASCF